MTVTMTMNATEKTTNTMTMAQRESLLLDQAQIGDSMAFGELVRMYQDRLFNAVYYLLRNRVDAEDVVQDAFVQAYTKLDTFRRGSTFYTWIYRIAMNLAVSRGRRAKSRMSLEARREVCGDEPAYQGEGPGEQLMRQEQAAEIESALESLSDEHRQILVLRGIDGLDYDQIADVLAINPGTVRSRLHRARSHFRDRLNRYEACGA